MTTGLQLDDLHILRDGRTLIGLDVSVPPGTILTVMGPSGAGKSTLLAAITGTLSPPFTMTGTIRLNGRMLNHLPPQDRHTGLMLQDDLLFPHMSVGNNLAFGLSAATRGRPARRDRIASALAEIGMEGFADRDPATLSGGQRARVALMRVLLSDPAALLLDEPFSRLDAELRDQMRQLVFDRARARNLPVLLVTHDESDAEAAGGPVARLG